MDIGAPFPEAGGQVEEFLKLGGQVCICNACMEHNGFKAEQMDERYVLINAPDVVSLLMGAKGLPADYITFQNRRAVILPRTKQNDAGYL